VAGPRFPDERAKIAALDTDALLTQTRCEERSSFALQCRARMANTEPREARATIAVFLDPHVKPAQHPTALRVAQLLRDAGVITDVVEFEQPTRTSAEAAAAIGCSVAEIAKTIVFRGGNSGQAIVVVASGDRRVSVRKVEAQIGEPLDEGLRRFDVVWAAGGTPFSVFPVGPDRLPGVTGAPWADVRE
jgi:prolyl-tRNA editing enzyme YbaK/EbsC (Cys-tRNA(Pro) deacylase)